MGYVFKMKILFWFKGNDFDLFEIKKEVGAYEKDPSKIYQWLILTKYQLIKLDFQEMGSDSRKFQNAMLSFNIDFGNLKIGQTSYQLKRENPDLASPFKVLIEKRLDVLWPLENDFCLSQIKLSDISYFLSWIKDPDVILYSLTKFHQMESNESRESWFYSMILDSKTYQFSILDKNSMRIIGYAGIAGINHIDRNGEFFILIGEKKYWGKGIATQVASMLIKKGFHDLGLHRIFLTASSDNPGALKAYERAGFKMEGIMKEAFYRHHKYSDKVVMGVLKD